MTRAVNPRVAALIYGDGEQPADSQLRAQLDSQVVAPVETLFIHSRPGDLAFASEVSSALSGLPRGITWIWLLDSSVELSRSTLAELLQRAEVSPSAAIIGAKQLRQQDRSILSSLGISISQLAEPVRLRSGEFDQGQHDADSDVLAADPNCSLVLRDTFEGEIGALATSPGQAFGYELGMRVRVAGRRVLVEPRALCWVVEPPDANKLAGQFAVLTARIHLAFLTLPLALVLSYLVLAPLLIPLSIGSALLRKLPAQAIAAPAAIVWSWVTVANRLRARASLRVLGGISGQRDFWLTRSELRKLRMMNQSSEIVIAEARTRLFESGVVWWLLVPVLASFQLFAYGVAQSGELAPLSGSLPELLRTAFVTQQPYSDGVFTTTDP
ncbi:MAG: hypothetical protein RL198_273, partial [Actinomycetota bacterium]